MHFLDSDCVSSESEEDLDESGLGQSDEPEIDSNNLDWFDVNSNNIHNDIKYKNTEYFAYDPTTYPENKEELTPLDVYRKLIDDDVLELIAKRTNDNADQIRSGKEFSKTSRLFKWQPTNKEEILKCLGLIIYMGLVTYPSVADYWRKSLLYNNSLAPKVMSRNRFQILIKFLNFADNGISECQDRFYKVREIFNIIQDNFAKEYIPGELLSIDENIVPYKGAMRYSHYTASKSLVYCLKVFKLCNPKGYTLRMGLYTGQNMKNGRTLSHNIALHLAQQYLDKGRTLITGSFCTSVPLAQELLQRKTHLLGIMQRRIPKQIADAKLKKGQIMGAQNSNGVVVAKWKGTRDVVFLTTKHGLDVKTSGKRNSLGEEIRKPKALLEYSRGKEGVDASTQNTNYLTPLRKTIRWYHKAALELLINTAVVNSCIILNSHRKKKLTFTTFREQLVLQIFGLKDVSEDANTDIKKKKPSNGNEKKTKHILVVTQEKTNNNRKKRKRCVQCYKEAVKEGGRLIAQKKSKYVTSYCNECNKFLCVTCFTKIH